MSTKNNVIPIHKYFQKEQCYHEFDPLDIFQEEERCHKCGLIREVFPVGELMTDNPPNAWEEEEEKRDYVEEKIAILENRIKRLTSLS